MAAYKSDTKLQIFNTALRLFAAQGYENVSMRIIAEAVGIKAASIYYHYSSKELLLNECYDFYIAHRHITRLEQDQYEPIMRRGAPEEVLDILNYSFPADVLENMLYCLFIIFARSYNDDKAKSVLVDDINCSMQYLIDFFAFGIKIGRFEEFNVSAVSLIIMSARMFMAQAITMNLEHTNDWKKVGEENFQQLLKLVPFKY